MADPKISHVVTSQPQVNRINDSPIRSVSTYIFPQTM